MCQILSNTSNCLGQTIFTGFPLLGIFGIRITLEKELYMWLLVLVQKAVSPDQKYSEINIARH